MKLTNWLKSRLVRSQKARRHTWHSQRTRLLERLEDRSLLAAQDITGLGAGGWLSDDTRSAPSGTDLVGVISTHAGKPGQVATTADDLAIAQQLTFVSTTAFPGATYGGAVSLAGTTSNSGKTSFSTIDVATGLAAADELIDPAFSASYQWLSQGTRTSPLKFGIQSTQWGTGVGESQNGFTAIRSGESAWDLILVHDLTTPVSNVWNTNSATANSGNWFLFAQAGNSYFSTNYNAGGGLGAGLGSRTLSAWNTLPTAVLGVTWGNLLFDSGAIVSSVQFGVGSGQSNATNLVDYVDISFLNGGDVIDFGSVQNTYVDQPGDFTSTFDADNSGTLTNGDRVTWNGPTAVPNLTYGLNAFSSIQTGIGGVATGGTVYVAAGTYNEDVLANKTSTILGAGFASTIVSGPFGGGGSTFTVTANNVDISGFTITRDGNNTTDWNNPALNTAGVSVQGQDVTGMVIHDNRITGNRTGIDVNNSNDHTIRNNVITNNRTGMIFRNVTDNETVVENEITDNWTVGILFLDASGGTNIPVQSALNSTFSNNNISGNWYGGIVDRQAGGALPLPGLNLKNFSGNWFGTRAPVITTANSSEPGYAVQIPVAFGGTATAPGGQPDVAGPASANFDITPLLGTAVDTDVETSPGLGTFGFQGDYSDIIVTSQLAQTGLSGRIQEGIDVATSGGTVHVLAGAYSGGADATGNSVILSPGSSPAQVSVNGNLTLDGDDTLPVEINGLSAATDYDNLIITGTVSLGGATLIGTGTRPANDGDVLVLIKNDLADVVTGTFQGQPEGSMIVIGGVTYRVTYKYNAEAATFGNGNDVALIDISGVTTPAPGTITLVTDPCDPTKVALVVAGTSADDNIDVKLKGKDQVEVRIDPKGGAKITMTIPLAAITGHIIVYGLAGNDHLSIADKIGNEAWLFGDLGNDHLQAGDGNSVLVGGDGDDHLEAGKGRDLLIGGDGKDHLQGRDDDDILIAGFTNHDDDLLALCAIMDEWTSGNNYNVRRGNLAGLLNAGTVHDDGDEDKLEGQQGLDWFFANVVGAGVKDKVNGVKPGEAVEDI